jgi:putative phosphoesterase
LRIGILSDTHDQVARTGRAVAMLQAEGAAALIHCGDLTGPDVVYECCVLPCYYVFGNNDFDEDALRAAMNATGGVCLETGGLIELAGRRIAVAHGDLPREVRRLESTAPDYLLFGHSHHPTDQREASIRWINPGALHRASTWTVALLDLAKDELEFLAVH